MGPAAGFPRSGIQSAHLGLGSDLAPTPRSPCPAWRNAAKGKASPFLGLDQVPDVLGQLCRSGVNFEDVSFNRTKPQLAFSFLLKMFRKAFFSWERGARVHGARSQQVDSPRTPKSDRRWAESTFMPRFSVTFVVASTRQTNGENQ